MVRVNATLLVLTSVLLLGCTSTGGIAPKVEEASLSEAARQFTHAIAAKDPELIASFFAEDATAMYPFPSPTVGREANREAWASYFSSRETHPVSIDTVVVSASRDMGYIMGRHANAEVESTDSEGGRYVAVWRRGPEGWRITVLSAHVHSDIKPFRFSSN